MQRTEDAAGNGTRRVAVAVVIDRQGDRFLERDGVALASDDAIKCDRERLVPYPPVAQRRELHRFAGIFMCQQESAVDRSGGFFVAMARQKLTATALDSRRQRKPGSNQCDKA